MLLRCPRCSAIMSVCINMVRGRPSLAEKQPFARIHTEDTTVAKQAMVIEASLGWVLMIYGTRGDYYLLTSNVLFILLVLDNLSCQSFDNRPCRSRSMYRDAESKLLFVLYHCHALGISSCQVFPRPFIPDQSIFFFGISARPTPILSDHSPKNHSIRM